MSFRATLGTPLLNIQKTTDLNSGMFSTNVPFLWFPFIVPIFSSRKLKVHYPETNSQSPWKMMLGRLFFPFGAKAYFQGLSSVSFREGIPRKSTCPSKRDHLKGQESSSNHWFWGGYVSFLGSTWRIIPVSKWLITTMYRPFKPFGRGPTPQVLGTYDHHGYFPRILSGMIPKKDTYSYLRLPSNPMAYFGFGGCGFGEKNGNNLRTCEHVVIFYFFSRPELSSFSNKTGMWVSFMTKKSFWQTVSRESLSPRSISFLTSINMPGTKKTKKKLWKPTFW